MSDHGKIKAITRNGTILNLYAIMTDRTELKILTTLRELGLKSPDEIGQDVDIIGGIVSVSRRVPEGVGIVEGRGKGRWIV